VISYIPFSILVAMLGASRFWSGRSLWFKYIFVFSIIAIFASNFYFSYLQYQTWLNNDFTKYFLPPYVSINYFIFYIFTRFFASYLISLGASVLFLFSAKILNKKYEERFFEPEEYYFGALSIFLSSHPGCFFYLIFLIFAYLLIHLYSSFIAHSSSFRISLYHLWIPVAIFVILISSWLKNLSIWQLLKF